MKQRHLRCDLQHYPFYRTGYSDAITRVPGPGFK